MSYRDNNPSLQDYKDSQKVAGSNLNVLDLQWELLINEGGYWESEKVMQTLKVDSPISL